MTLLSSADHPSRRTLSVRLALTLLLSLASLLTLVATPTPARADSTETTILEDDPLVLANPTATLMQARALGITTLRLKLPWGAVAPASSSPRRPRFNPTDPRAYGGAWGPYDAAILAAHTLGITVDLDLSPGAPRWATGGGQPRNVKGYPWWQWEPDAGQFRLFVQAVGERYSGSFDPVTDRIAPGNPADLPRISFWSVWNEPNYGPSLAPQGLPGHPGVENSPRMYRNLVDAAWSGLAGTGHRTPADTIIIGELAPRSQLTAPGRFTNFNGMTPMVFLQNLYCLTPQYRPLRGTDAALRGCPTNAAGTRAFISRNPGLFHNSGISDHPYDEWFAPNQELDIPKLKGWALENTQDTSLATIGVLERGLNRLTAAYGDREQLPIWDTEYGYQTSPPHRYWSGDHRPWPSAQTAALYDNWGEYLQWKNPRFRSFAQYLIRDPLPATRQNDYGSFASGLVSYGGRPKADLEPFQMPIYLPRTTAASPYSSLEVWGGARPAIFASADLASSLGSDLAPQTVTLLFRPLGSTHFSTIDTVALNATGNYDVHLAFPASGTLVARWQTPVDSLLRVGTSTLQSRAVTVTVR